MNQPTLSSSYLTRCATRMRSKSYITPRPSPLIKTSSNTNIPVFVGCYSSAAANNNQLIEESAADGRNNNAVR